MSAEIRRLLERHYQAWSEGDVEGIVDCFTDDAIMEDLALPHAFEGKEGIRQMALAVGAGMPDLQWVPKIICVDGNIATTEWLMTGTHKGDLPRIGPATGGSFCVPGMSIDEIRDGLIHRHRDYWNLITYRAQVGLPV